MTSPQLTPANDSRPRLDDIEPPPLTASAITLSGPTLTPSQRIAFYSPNEWEVFIREWASGLPTTYVQIKRLGGPNDKGVDVAAFKTSRGFEGEWDCFQGKHYEKALAWSDAFPEILKVFVGVAHGHYVLPDTYAFLAPKGCGTALARLLSRPSELQTKFIAELNRTDAAASRLDAPLRERVRDIATSTDFTLFKSIELVDAISMHRRTPYHVARFGGPLPPRPPTAGAPAEIASREARYVDQLVDVYREQDPASDLTPALLHHHPTFGAHFQRQRESFYSAEALRLHARDAVPPGTFEALQDDVHAGVIEMADSEYESSMERLTQVLQASTQIDLSAHALTSISRIADRKGICHQLANEDRLKWVRP